MDSQSGTRSINIAGGLELKARIVAIKEICGMVENKMKTAECAERSMRGGRSADPSGPEAAVKIRHCQMDE